MKHFSLIPLAIAAMFLCGCTAEKTPEPVQHTVRRPVQTNPAPRTIDDFGLPLVINLDAPAVPAEIAGPTLLQTP